MDEFKLISPEETLKLISQAKQGDEEAKTKLLGGNYPLIKSVIKRFAYKKIEYDDLYQLGCVGFLKAITNFEPEYGVKFSTYAVPMIAGEIKRFMRDDGEIKVSRSLKSLAIKINKEIAELQKQGKESPTASELAEKFEVTPDEVVLAIESTKPLVSIYEKTADKSESSPNLIDKLTQSEAVDETLEKIMLKDLIKALPEKERKIILLRYFRGLTQTEIAREMQVSQVQISRVEARVLKTLKEKMQ